MIPQPSLFEVRSTPQGIDIDVWNGFVALADELRAAGLTRYGAKSIAETLRYHSAIKRGSRPFKVNNNQVTAMAAAYVALRGCPDFFEFRSAA